MSEVYKVIISFILFMLWSIGLFFAGVLYNGRTNGAVDDRDNEYQREQQEFDEQIAVTTGTISGITNDIQQQIYISTRAVGNLQELLQEIRKQRIDI